MIDFKEIEKKWQKAWEEAKIFEANPNKKKKFFLTVPYPYTSGTLHVGHGRTYTLGDITARFKRAQGFNVLWPLAWHITGTPVLAIAKRIENGEEVIIKEHKEYISLHNPDKVEEIIKSFVNPENVANYYASVISNDLKELGCSIDWRRQFTTGEKIYNKFVEWQYYHLDNLGYLKKGKHPVFFCPSCNNPVTTDDVKRGDEIRMSIEEVYLIKENFEDGYLVVATLRPETIFGVTNIWINPKVEYVKAKVNGENWYVCEKAVDKLKNQGFSVEVIERIFGDKLIGKEVEVPIVNRKVYILPAGFVRDDVGTGIVNSVPAHAPYDYIALEELKEKPESLAVEIAQKIKEISPISLFEVPGFSEFPAKDMCEKFKIKSQSESPKLDKATQEIYSKEFYLGKCKETCMEFQKLPVKEAKNKVFEKLLKENLVAILFENSSKDQDENPVKEIFCRCGARVIIKVLEEQWFLDYSNKEWKEKAKKLLNKLEIVPNIYRKQFEDTIDWLHEWACARSRGLGTKLPQDEKWIIESLSDSTIYMAFYTIVHLLRDAKVEPEKLKKEFFDFVFLGIGKLEDVARVTGIDKRLIKRARKEFLYWYPVDERRTAIAHIPNHLTFSIFHHATIFPEELWPKRFSLNELLIAEGKKMSKSLGNVIPLATAIRKHSADAVRLYLAYAAEENSTLDWREVEVTYVRKRLERFYKIFDLALKEEKGKKLKLFDKWLISKFYKILNEATQSLNNYRFKQYAQKIFFEMMNEVEQYIHRGGSIAINKILPDWLIALHPLIPHTAEELWHKLGNQSFVSLRRWPKVKKVDEKLLELEENLRKALEDLREVVKLTGKKDAAYIYVATKDELKYFKENLEFIKRYFELKKISIYLASDEKRYDPENRAIKAKYGKVGIYLE
jgi:leucyl-tRNA synthetase